MAQIRSLFGAYADQLQTVIDSKLALFDPTWYQNYFDWATRQNTLTFVQAIGRSRIEAAASIVNRDSLTPLRSRAGLEKLTGSIPAIKEKFQMTEDDYRDFLTMQALQGVDSQSTVNNMLDLLFDDTKKVGNAAHKRLDIMALEAISTGQISLTVTNNPDGVVLDNAVDLFMPSANRVDGVATWAVAANAKPLSDIEKMVLYARKRGIKFAKILMTPELFQYLRASAETQASMLTFYYGPKAAGTSPQAVTTLDKVNDYLTAQQFPIIEIVDVLIGIEKDGKITSFNPFNANNASFVPAGKLGTIKNAIAIEELKKVTQVSYGNYNRALISKWQENEPFGEWTKVELNAFPAVDAIDSIHILRAVY